MNGLYQPLYAVLCLVSALAGSWTALDLFGRIHANIGRARSAWLIAASLALGLSIWAADFEAVLGAQVGARGHYDPALVALSLAVAIGAAGLAFFVASQRRGDPFLTLAAGAILGAGAWGWRPCAPFRSWGSSPCWWPCRCSCPWRPRAPAWRRQVLSPVRKRALQPWEG
jgi:hypothetical protein